MSTVVVEIRCRTIGPGRAGPKGAELHNAPWPRCAQGEVTPRSSQSINSTWWPFSYSKERRLRECSFVYWCFSWFFMCHHVIKCNSETGNDHYYLLMLLGNEKSD